MNPAEIWIDVGGTFTDCFLVRVDGGLSHYKILSTGVVKGSLGAPSTPQCVVDAARCALSNA